MARIASTGVTTWENRHLTFTQEIEDLCDMWNGDEGESIDRYNKMTDAIRQEIGKVISKGIPIRALGGGWSWTRIATCAGRMLNTKGLNTVFKISDANVSPQYQGESDSLLFAQCGNSILELNNYLGKKGRSLKTCGASNGQTIVGAMSTGTHGSAFDFGAVQDFVVAIHIITSPDKHYWLERKTYPVAAETLPGKFGAELLRDDEIFNAALVSFGSFGFIHGVMLETENIFLLECYRMRLPFSASLDHLMTTLDFSQSGSLPLNERPFHFQALVNPYDLDAGSYVNVMYKRPYRADYNPPVATSGGLSPGDDAPAFIGLLADVVPAATPLVVNALVGSSYKPYSNLCGTLGEIFTNTDRRGKVLSAAIGIPLDRVVMVKDLLLTTNNKNRFAGVFAFRYVKATKATLGFTKFSPVTCVVELDGVFSEKTLKFYHDVWETLDRAQIPFTFHWGKVCEIDQVRLEKMYGSNVISWIKARNRLLDRDSLRAFTNQQIVDWGLTQPVAGEPFIT